MKKAIFKLNFDCGRMGSLEGVFISTREKVDTLIENSIQVYFGEVLGKHSEVYGPIDEGEITFISDDENVVNVIEKYGLTSGHNPFHYTSINFELDGERVDDVPINEIVEKILESKK